MDGADRCGSGVKEMPYFLREKTEITQLTIPKYFHYITVVDAILSRRCSYIQYKWKRQLKQNTSSSSSTNYFT